MNDLWTVFLLSLLPGAGNFLGGMAAAGFLGLLLFTLTLGGYLTR